MSLQYTENRTIRDPTCIDCVKEVSYFDTS
jgi:hypothetical protein